MSNIGAIESRPADSKLHHCCLGSILWVQSAMVTGPLFTVGAVSVEDGALSFSTTWQEGAIDDELADSIVDRFADLLRCAM